MMVDTSHQITIIEVGTDNFRCSKGGKVMATIKINKDTTVSDISTQLAEIIDSPQFLDMLIDTQDCIIDMYEAVNKTLFSKEVCR